MSGLNVIKKGGQNRIWENGYEIINDWKQFLLLFCKRTSWNTGKSCIGNTYVPEYELDREKMEILQQIAHEAVAKTYGEMK